MSAPGIDVATDVHGIHGPAIDVSAIERELADLWRMPTVVGLRETDIVPTRTSVLNLVVFAKGEKQSVRINRIISELATNHPSRAIIFTLLKSRGEFNDDIDAHVSTHCYAASGERFAACFEQIEVRTPRDSLEQLPSIIRALALPDLPTFIWWPGQPALADRRFLRIAEVADRMVLDSLDFAHCTTNLMRLAAQCRQLEDCCAVSDLNWARLTPWRAMTAQFFDMPEARWALDSLRQVDLEYGQTPGETDNISQALLLTGWLASRLGWQMADRPHRDDGWLMTAYDHQGQSIHLRLRSRPVSRAFNGQLLTTVLVSHDGHRDHRLELSRTGDDHSTVKMIASHSGQVHLERAMHATPADIGKLLVRELQRRWHDTLYEDALQEASRFASALKQRGHA